MRKQQIRSQWVKESVIDICVRLRLPLFFSRASLMLSHRLSTNVSVAPPRDTPCIPILCTNFKLFARYSSVADIALMQFVNVFSMISFSLWVLYIEKLICDSVVVPSDDMPYPSKVGFQDYAFSVSSFYAIWFPGQSKPWHMKVIQQFDVYSMQGQIVTSWGQLFCSQ